MSHPNPQSTNFRTKDSTNSILHYPSQIYPNYPTSFPAYPYYHYYQPLYYFIIFPSNFTLPKSGLSFLFSTHFCHTKDFRYHCPHLLLYHYKQFLIIIIFLLAPGCILKNVREAEVLVLFGVTKEGQDILIDKFKIF